METISAGIAEETGSAPQTGLYTHHLTHLGALVGEVGQRDL
jgi:hypothetical protein